MRKITGKLRWVTAAVLLVAAVALIAPHIVVSAAGQQESGSYIQLSPTKDREKLEPGEKFTGSFDINNIGSEAFDFRVYVEPFSLTSDCVEQYATATDFTKMTSWVNFDQNNYYDLEPGRTQTVTFHIDVPKDAPSGGQYIVIFAETGSFNPTGGTAIKVNKRVGYKFYADLGGTDHQAGNVESLTQKGWFWSPPINSTSKVRNTGNVDFTEEHVFTLTGLGGKEVYKSTNQEDVLPDTCRIISPSWSGTPAFGIFWAKNTINFLGHEQFSARKLVIVIPIYVVVIFGIMIVLLIWAAVLKIRGNSKKSGTKSETSR